MKRYYKTKNTILKQCIKSNVTSQYFHNNYKLLVVINK